MYFQSPFLQFECLTNGCFLKFYKDEKCLIAGLDHDLQSSAFGMNQCQMKSDQSLQYEFVTLDQSSLDISNMNFEKEIYIKKEFQVLNDQQSTQDCLPMPYYTYQTLEFGSSASDMQDYNLCSSPVSQSNPSSLVTDSFTMEKPFTSFSDFEPFSEQYALQLKIFTGPNCQMNWIQEVLNIDILTLQKNDCLSTNDGYLQLTLSEIEVLLNWYQDEQCSQLDNQISGQLITCYNIGVTNELQNQRWQNGYSYLMEIKNRPSFVEVSNQTIISPVHNETREEMPQSNQTSVSSDGLEQALLIASIVISLVLLTGCCLKRIRGGTQTPRYVNV